MEGIKNHDKKFRLYSVINRESVKIFEQESNKIVIIFRMINPAELSVREKKKTQRLGNKLGC